MSRHLHYVALPVHLPHARMWISQFCCHRKDKYGLNLQAICDHRLKFICVEMKWPGVTSDCMAWVISALCRALKDNHITKKVLEGFTFVWDNAYVKKMLVAVLLKGVHGGYDNGYNCYLSQLRITIERGCLVCFCICGPYSGPLLPFHCKKWRR